MKVNFGGEYVVLHSKVARHHQPFSLFSICDAVLKMAFFNVTVPYLMCYISVSRSPSSLPSLVWNLNNLARLGRKSA